MIHVYFCPRCPTVTLVRDDADTSMHGHPALDRLSHRALCPICTLSMSYHGVEQDVSFVRPEPEPEEPKAKRKYTRREKAPAVEPGPSDQEKVPENEAS